VSARPQVRWSTKRKVALACAAAAALAALAWLALREDAIAPASAAPPRVEEVAADTAAPSLRGAASEELAPATPSSAAAASEPSASLERQEVSDDAAGRLKLRGRIVDARTGQGLQQVEVKLRSGDQETRDSTQTDTEGRFASQVNFASGSLWVWGMDLLAGRTLGRIEHAHAAAEDGKAGELEWRVAVGPTLIAKLVDAPQDRVWRLRLIEDPGQPGALEWKWLYAKELAPSELLGVRYAAYEHEPATFRDVRVQVASSDDVWRGEARVENSLGVHEVELRVEAVGAALEGLVLDEDRKPVAATLVALGAADRPASRLQWPETTTDDLGLFRFVSLEPGPLHLLVASDHRAVERVAVDLLPGERRSVEVVLPRVAVAGSVRGVLAGPVEGEEPIGIVRLVSADGGKTDLVRVCVAMSLAANPPGDGRTPFEFADLPRGRYRVSVLSLDERAYAPDSIVVEAPSTVEFRTDQVAAPVHDLRYALDLRDAQTGERLDGARSLFHFPPFWSTVPMLGDPVHGLAFLGENAPVTLVFARDGYIPAALYMPDAYRAARREGEVVEVQLGLQRGHGLALIVLDAGQTLGGRSARASELSAMPTLAGARILVGGRLVGTSDARGLALCASGEPIADFDVELAGWTALSTQPLDEDDSNGIRSPSAVPLRFVFMVRQ
jgi:hypothetical protein